MYHNLGVNKVSKNWKKLDNLHYSCFWNSLFPFQLLTQFQWLKKGKLKIFFRSGKYHISRDFFNILKKNSQLVGREKYSASSRVTPKLSTRAIENVVSQASGSQSMYVHHTVYEQNLLVHWSQEAMRLFCKRLTNWSNWNLKIWRISRRKILSIQARWSHSSWKSGSIYPLECRIKVATLKIALK